MSKFTHDSWHAYGKALTRLPGVQVTRRATFHFGVAGLATLLGCGLPDRPRGDEDEDDAGTGQGGGTAQGGVGGSGGSDASVGSTSTGQGGSGGDAATVSSTATGGELEPITLEELMAIIHPEAQALVAMPSPDEVGYHALVEAELARLAIDLADLNPSDYQLASLAYQAPIEVYEIDMAPGAEIPFHDHRQYIGSILAVEGSATATHYTQISEPDGFGWFEVQLGKDLMLTPGATASLSLAEDNFHVVRAGSAGAKLVDVFTFFSPNGASYFAYLDPDPVDPAQGIYRAKY